MESNRECSARGPEASASHCDCLKNQDICGVDRMAVEVIPFSLKARSSGVSLVITEASTKMSFYSFGFV